MTYEIVKKHAHTHTHTCTHTHTYTHTPMQKRLHDTNKNTHTHSRGLLSFFFCSRCTFNQLSLIHTRLTAPLLPWRPPTCCQLVASGAWNAAPNLRGSSSSSFPPLRLRTCRRTRRHSGSIHLDADRAELAASFITPASVLKAASSVLFILGRSDGANSRKLLRLIHHSQAALF